MLLGIVLERIQGALSGRNTKLGPGFISLCHVDEYSWELHNMPNIRRAQPPDTT